MVTEDYKTLKSGLEGLAMKDKIPIEHDRVLKNCETNSDGDVEMDVSEYDRKHIESIKNEIDLIIVRKDEDTLLVKGDFI